MASGLRIMGQDIESLASWTLLSMPVQTMQDERFFALKEEMIHEVSWASPLRQERQSLGRGGLPRAARPQPRDRLGSFGPAGPPRTDTADGNSVPGRKGRQASEYRQLGEPVHQSRCGLTPGCQPSKNQFNDRHLGVRNVESLHGRYRCFRASLEPAR